MGTREWPWVHSKAAISKDVDKNGATQKIDPYDNINLIQADLLNTQPSSSPRPPLNQTSETELPLASCFQKGCCLHLVMFIKMAAVPYLNVNYCCDTQDNLTCFSNLFFLLIRCSNWKIFQNVTTVAKVKWQRKGASPKDLNYESGAGCSGGGHPDEPCQGSEMGLLESSTWHHNL